MRVKLPFMLGRCSVPAAVKGMLPIGVVMVMEARGRRMLLLYKASCAEGAVLVTAKETCVSREKLALSVRMAGDSTITPKVRGGVVPGSIKVSFGAVLVMLCVKLDALMPMERMGAEKARCVFESLGVRVASRVRSVTLWLFRRARAAWLPMRCRACGWRINAGQYAPSCAPSPCHTRVSVLSDV